MPADTHLPVIEIQVKLGPAFEAAQKPASMAETSARIEAAVAVLIEALGIPARPHARLAPLEPDPDDPRPMRVLVNGKECFYPAPVLARAREYAYRMVDAGLPDPAATGEYAALAVQTILLHQPQVLLGPAQLEAYRLSLPVPQVAETADWPPSSAFLEPILRDTLAMRISIGDQQTVAETLAQGLADQDSLLDITEELISWLRVPEVEIHLHPDFLRALTLNSTAEDRDWFPLLRDGLFLELGQIYPPFKFVPDEHLTPPWVAFRLNHLLTLPYRSLEVDELAANILPEELSIVGVRPGNNPIYGHRISILPAAARPELPGEIYTWSPMGYLMLCLAAVLRRHGDLLVDLDYTGDQLDLLIDTHPDLVGAALEQISLAQLMRVLRAFAAERLSILDFRQILEYMLDYDYVVVPEPETFIILDDRLPTGQMPGPDWLADPVNLTAFIRMRMQLQISYHYTQGESSLAVYPVDTEIESNLLALAADPAAGNTAEEFTARLLSACRRIVDPDPGTHKNTPLITTSEVRPYLRALVAAEFPQLPVLAYQELRPGLGISLLDRITLVQPG
jgi:flagellar biosynthesis component FlhA